MHPSGLGQGFDFYEHFADRFNRPERLSLLPRLVHLCQRVVAPQGLDMHAETISKTAKPISMARVPLPIRRDVTPVTTRPGGPGSKSVEGLIEHGASPRAAIWLMLGAKAHAALNGSYMARLEDIVSVAEPVLTHRVLTTFNAESEGIGPREIVQRLVEETEKA